MSTSLGNVLLAFEERVAADELTRALGEAGLSATFSSPADAPAALSAGPVDVLVTSSAACGPPHELLEQARRHDPELEVVVATGPDGFAGALAALRRGASDLVALPLDAASLASAVRGAWERRRARGLAAELRRVARSAGLGDLAGGLAHDIANPVAVLLSALGAMDDSLAALAGVEALATTSAATGAFSSWWQREGRPALTQAREASVEAAAGAERLKLLARDLRGMARGDPAAAAPFDVAEALQAALRMARPELTGQARVETEVPPGLVALGSQGAFAQALLHVLVRAGRAFAAAKQRGSLRVRGARAGEGTVLLEVEDDAAARGDGLTRWLGPELPEGTPDGPGALGLAVARALVERQGGTIRARPGPGHGTVFELRLPAAPQRQAPGRA